jgi:hypothetical protein
VRRSAPWGWPSICGRRLPSGSCGLPEGWAAHLSPEPVARPGLRPPIRPCSGWSLPRFTPPADPKAGRRHRHCGTGPRLTTDGRYPPPCAEELGLSSRDRRIAPTVPRDHPTASLTTGYYAQTRRPRRFPGWASVRCRPYLPRRSDPPRAHWSVARSMPVRQRDQRGHEHVDRSDRCGSGLTGGAAA